jgi:hypothetical protein
MAIERVDAAFVADWNDRDEAAPEHLVDYRRRALWIWPGLDRARLARAHNDPVRIARLVSGRTTQPLDTILALLLDLGRTDLRPAISR